MVWNKYREKGDERILEMDEAIAGNEGEAWLPTFKHEGNTWFFLMEGFLSLTEEDAIKKGKTMDEVMPLISLIGDVKPTGEAVPMYSEEYVPDGKEIQTVEFFSVNIGGFLNGGLLSGPLFDEIKEREDGVR